ncbi:MAG: aldo/keto reductase, partial [Actinobacteria bacterium]|nr:aldo/keto reductase [Actinomycetota bacterium]
MEQRPLGRSGLWVGRFGLGTMTWGRTTDEYEARDQLAVFLDAGGTLVDTADTYADGASEEMLGELLAEFGARDQVVLATKAVSTSGLERKFNASRGHILAALETSLRRLRTGHIDLWQMHAWDPSTPMEETLSAIDDAVQS